MENKNPPSGPAEIRQLAENPGEPIVKFGLTTMSGLPAGRQAHGDDYYIGDIKKVITEYQ